LIASAFRECAKGLASASSFLFVPADDERRLRKAMASHAHVVIADLEDAVHPERKGEARETLARVLAEDNVRDRLVTVRVNSSATAEGAEDERLVATLPIDGVVIPKASPGMPPIETPIPLIPIVETAHGLRLAYEIARITEVVRLMLGTIDLGAQLGLSPLPHSIELLHARSRLVLDSAAAGIARPIDGVELDVRDERQLRRRAIRSRALGFGAKACVHPAQLGPVNRAFAPTPDEVAWARQVHDGYRAARSDGRGAVLVAGEMIDAPVARRAQAILAEARDGE
jgi:citrate lyase subunit beta/citryl-CoA lyase